MPRTDLNVPAAQGALASEEISEESRRRYKALMSGDRYELAQLHRLAKAAEQLQVAEDVPIAVPSRRQRLLAALRS